MKKALLFFAIAILSVAYVNAQDMSMEEILKKHFEAVGQDKLGEVKTMKMTGTMLMQGMEFPLTMIVKRPNKIKFEMEIQGTTMVQAFNGTEGYMINPMSGSTEPQDMGEDQVKDMKDNADIDGKLFDYKKKGSSLELIGTEDMEGTEVYKLKLTEKPEEEGKEGDIIYYFIDSENFIILKQVTKKNMNGNEMEMETFPSNYKQVKGIVLPHSMESKANGNSMMQMTIKEYSLNEEMADDLFDKPAKKEGE